MFTYGSAISKRFFIAILVAASGTLRNTSGARTSRS